MTMKNKILFIAASIILLLSRPISAEEKWNSRRSTHFIVYYKDAPDDFVDNVIESAEEYYREITSDLGFMRYGSWSWEERCQIYIYRDSEEYVQATKQPGWSGGSVLYREKIINTYPMAAGFFDTMLPHELGHIIFREFIGYRVDLPLWLDEGVASYQEKARRWGSNKMVKAAIQNKTFIPIDELTKKVLSSSSDRSVVEIFYAEAGSLVYYLITKFGKYRFVDFCRALKEGDGLDKALSSTYSKFNNAKELEQDWLKDLASE